MKRKSACFNPSEQANNSKALRVRIDEGQVTQSGHLLFSLAIITCCTTLLKMAVFGIV